jgi:hypothetical protein
VAAQRPALSGEKAQVAEAVKADLTRLSELQTAHHNRSRVYAADARDLGFNPTSGATINIAYASMNAWAANATHPTLSPVACFIIISSAEPSGPAAQPFCQEGRPGGGTAPSAPAPTTPPSGPTQQPAPQTSAPTRPPAAQPATTTPTATPLPRQAARETQPQQSPAPAQGRATAQATGTPLRSVPASALAGTRDIDIAGIAVPTQTENVTAQQFSQKLNDFAQGATTMYAELQARNESIVRDPYESTAEFEARRAEAFAATQRREREFFQQNSKVYTVAMPVREVRYDPDREIFEFTVDGFGLPVTRGTGSEAASLTLTCFSRPVFWCSTEAGMIYEAGDMWRIPRATARQHDILRTPLTLNARFAVGRRNDAPVLSIGLLSMDLQARGQSVSRWDGAAR